MKILLVNSKHVPEIGSQAHLYHDMAKKFTELGHEVHVIASYPRDFNLSDEDKGKDFPTDEIIDGVHVHRAKFRFSTRDNILIRGIEHFYFPRLFYKKYKELEEDFDVALMYVPPLPLYKFGEKIRKKDGVPFVSNHQDIHPQELIDQGLIKDPITKMVLKFIERNAYKAPDGITVMSPEEKELVENRGGKNVKCIYNGIDVKKLEKNLPKPTFKEEENISNKTLVVYGGILSPFQGLGDILDAAKLLKQEKDVIFYIVGDGMMKEKLKKRISNENINNVKMLPFQPRNEYFRIINSADITIISLDNKMASSSFLIPGKISDLMCVEKPIIANVPEGNATGRIIEENDCGIRVNPGDSKQFAEAVKKIKNNPQLAKQMGENGKEFLKKKMDLNKNAKRYEEIFEKIIENRGDNI